MSLEIKVPPVGESITEVTLSRWIKKDGDSVAMDEVIAELESDKATFELTAEKAGTLKTIAKEGDTLAIGAAVASIEEGGAPAPAKAAAPAAQPQPEVVANAPAPEPAAAAPVTSAPATGGGSLQVKVPTVGESITEVTLSRWIKKDGDTVAMDEAIAELESDKATFELTAEKAGVLKTMAKEGDVLPIGAVVCTIEGAGVATAPKTVEPVAATAPATTSATSSEKTYASGTPSPAAAKILAEKGINPASVPGNGVDGRITKADALIAVNADLVSENPQGGRKSEAGSPKPEVKTQDPVLKTTNSDRERREKMSPLRKTVARRLVTVKNETAMLTTFNEVDMSPIMELRAKYKDKFKEKHGVGLGFMSFFTKAVCEALREWPAVGARIEGEEVVYSNFADISIAVSAPKGLVVPVIRNADAMSLAEIEKAVAALAVKARDNKLSLEEMTGGTFTITNGGVFGSMMSTPIINSPQSAILGMHNIIERPVAVNGQVVIKPMMYVALSYDHRIIDGRESVSFLVRVKQLLEDPARLLLGV
jgi:2-oxoglutarate dehydrogenase E2 component (dihydrolipoamide succinyltransferase)